MGGCFFVKSGKWGAVFCKKVDLSSIQGALFTVSVLFYFTFYCQSTKAKLTLWSVDLIEGLNCWNML